MISYKLRLKSLAALALTCGVFGCSPISQSSQSTPTPQGNASVIQTGTSPAPEASSKPLVVATNTVACGLQQFSGN